MASDLSESENDSLSGSEDSSETDSDSDTESLSENESLVQPPFLHRVKAQFTRAHSRFRATLTQPYTYSKLADPHRDIRLLTILAALYVEDPLIVTIHHAPLPDPVAQPSRRLSIPQIRNTLPAGGSVHEILNGWYLSVLPSASCTSWTYPDPSIDRTLYDLPPNASASYPLSYEALSYTWGSPAATDCVFIETAASAFESHDPQSKPVFELPIQQNLADALRHLRNPDTPRVLWADAICINQGDLAERAEQVKRMADIYPRARRVRPARNAALEFVGKQLQQTKDGRSALDPDSIYRSAMQVTELKLGDETWATLIWLFHRPWFERMWIVQEIRFANAHAIVLCGRREVPWRLLRDAAMALLENDSRRGSVQREASSRIHQIQILCRDISQLSVVELLHESQGRLFQEDKDAIYGLYSLFPQGLQKRIPIDYSNAVSVVDVYANVVAAYMEHCTWTGGPVFSVNGYFCAGYSRASYRLASPCVLSIDGVRVATIREVGSPLPDFARETARVFWETVPSDFLTALYLMGGSLLESFAKAVSGLEHVSVVGPRDGGPIADRELGRWSFTTTVEGFIGFCPPWTARSLVTSSAYSWAAQPRYSSAPKPTGPTSSSANASWTPSQILDRQGARLRGVGHIRCVYVDTRTGYETLNDPRLGAFRGWDDPQGAFRRGDDPYMCARFRDNETGEIANYDPRITPEALRARGVDVESFDVS
ncbi:heterokaryon incompatibility protein-domain-containing protein [Podospora appendiculata]|uniref:Heterokaryon incompatibility protein-domain-containing protein n=1 Tax=Podospora appendiculata TaxID=314037 RepID=A0AAE1CCP6_9PEZI|nr:heterokaryon incompatibility protein-domain-containing protein [Podospora appendiculata]